MPAELSLMTRREASAEAIALHEACRAGHTAEVKLILQSKRVDVNARGAEGATPLCHLHPTSTPPPPHLHPTSPHPLLQLAPP